MSKEIILEARCPVCKKVFAYTPMWVFKREKKWVCSYSCVTRYDREHERRQHMPNKARMEKLKLLTEMINAGCGVKEISEKVGMNTRSVRYYRNTIIA